MSTIASLAVKLIADPSSAVRGLTLFSRAAASAGSRMNSTASLINSVAASMANDLAMSDPFALARTGISATTGAVQSLLGKIPYVGPAFSAMAGVIGGVMQEVVSWVQRGVALFKEGAAKIKEMSQTALEFGISMRSAGTITMAFGGDAEKGSTLMLRFQEALMESAAAMPGVATQFSRFNLDAKELAKLPLDVAWKKTTAAIQANGAATRNQAAMAIVGRRAAHSWIEVMAKGPEVFDKAEASLKRFGQDISEADAGSVKQAALALKGVDMAMEGIKMQVAVGLAPVILELADLFSDVGVNAEKVQEWAVTGAKAVAYAGAAAYEAWKPLHKVWDVLIYSLRSLFAGFVSFAAKLAGLLGKMPDWLGGDKFRGEAGKIKGYATELWKNLDADWKDTKARWKSDDKEDAFLLVDNFFQRAERRGKEMKKVRDALKGAAAGPTPAEQEGNNKLWERAQGIITDNRTSIEKFGLQMENLNELVAAGQLNWETYARAVGKAADELGEIRNPQMTGSAAFGSQEAYKIINQDMLNSSRQDPVAQLNNRFQTLIEISKRQQQRVEQIANAVKGGMFKVV